MKIPFLTALFVCNKLKNYHNTKIFENYLVTLTYLIDFLSTENHLPLIP